MNGDQDEFVLMGSPSECSYLPGRTSLFEYRLAINLTASRYDVLLEHGWRRFGRTLFRPQCPSCRECVGLRIDVGAWKPSKSQRRALQKNSDLQLTVVRPDVTDEHVELYNVYHEDMQQRRGWRANRTSKDQYYESFVAGRFSFSREFQYRRKGELVGLGIVDMTGTSMSSVYFIHHPAIRGDSPGTMSVAHELLTGQQTKHRWLYMGYYIRDCASMNYKNRFHPHQLLHEYVDDTQPAPWKDSSE
ncbi:MAG: arginyltransferase [Planctomycetaceae bacterium]|nr:arginyltransferase [Planctomycetaceae bacterium]